MKTCPVCGANAFDDAAKCFGCLHDFVSKGELDVCKEESSTVSVLHGGPNPPAFIIRFTPTETMGGGIVWSCEVEAAPA